MRDQLLRLCRDYVNYNDLWHRGLFPEDDQFYAKELAKAYSALITEIGPVRDLYVWCKEQISTTKRTGKRPWRMGMHLCGWFGDKDRRHKRAKLKADRRFRWHLHSYQPSEGSGPYYQVGWISRRRCYPKWTAREDLYRTISFDEERYEEDDDE